MTKIYEGAPIRKSPPDDDYADGTMALKGRPRGGSQEKVRQAVKMQKQ